MRLRHLYLFLCVLGVVLPYASIVPWLARHGLDIGLFLRELLLTRIGAFFALDVVVSALVLFAFIFTERRALGIRHVWIPVIATFFVGVSLGLPLFLYMRQRHLDSTNV
jgi:hypothetical protein